MPTDTTEKRPIDPGPARRKPGSCCKCFLVLVGIIAALASGLVLYFFVSVLYKMVNFSHSQIYHNDTASALNYSEVVTPLVDKDQTFDIAATVWITKTKEERDEWRLMQANQTTDYALWQRENHAPEVLQELVLAEEADGRETLLYSDVVFRGLRLKDKHIMADVPLRIPTAIFRSQRIYPYDLRASFVLIPTSPSPLDYLDSYTSWYPKELPDLPRTLPYPFPYNSSGLLSRTKQTRALMSFGIHVPLVRKLDILGRCHNDTEEAPKKDELDKIFDDPSKIDFDVIRNATKEDNILAEHNTTGNSSILRHHPHIVTRTQLRIVDETHVLNRTAYDEAFEALKKTACRLPSLIVHSAGGPAFSLCNRDYKKNGHWETRLTLSVPVLHEDGTTLQETREAYAPYMERMPVATGSKDVVRVPVDRETCPEDSPPAVDEDYMNVTWHVSFTGRTPAKFVLGGSRLPHNFITHQKNGTEYEAMTRHGYNELLNGLLGHRFSQDAHPRRKLGATMLSWIFLIPASVILAVHYWYTCSSTYSLSVTGTLLLVLSQVLSFVEDMIKELRPMDTWMRRCFALTIGLLLFLFVPFLMVKAALRLTFGWKGWLPVIRRANSTHLERISGRLEARIQWQYIGVAFAALTPILYLTDLDIYVLVNPSGPQPPPSADKTSPISMSLELISQVLQLLLNQQTGYFAGSYKAAVLIDAVGRVLNYLSYVSALFGPHPSYPGLSVTEVVFNILLAWTLWQVLTLRGGPGEVEDEDTE